MSRYRQTATFIPAELLAQHPANIRDTLGDLTDLARSIREHGILQPITVTEHNLGGFLILAGHRRYNAGQMVGLEKYPAIIRHELEDQAEQVVLMLVENTQRKDLDPVEKAQAFQALTNHGLSQSEIARRVGCAPSVINRHLAYLELDQESIELLRDGKVKLGDAHAAVVQMRQERREEAGGARRGRRLGTPQPAWFSLTHPLHKTVAHRCRHDDRPKVGKAGCGQCWEAAIVEDALAKAPAP